MSICLYDSADNGAQAQLTARWLYRTFLCDFVNDPRYMINAWKSLSKGGAEWPALHEMAFIAEQEGNDAAEIADHIKSTLIPLIREENRKNYTSILLYSDCSDIPKESRNENHKKKIHDFLADQIFYYRYVGMRPDEALNESLQLTDLVKSIIYNHLCESSDETRERGGRIPSKNIAALWDFIEKEATKGLHYRKITHSPDTDVIATAKKKNGIVTSTGALEFKTANGYMRMDSGADLFPDGDGLKDAYMYLMTGLAAQLPHYRQAKKPNGKYKIITSTADLTDKQRGEIDRKRTVTLTIDEYCRLNNKDRRDANRELRRAALSLLSAQVRIYDGGREWLVDIGSAMLVDSDNAADVTEHNYPQKLKKLEEETGQRIQDPICNGAITFRFSQDLAAFLSCKYVLAIHDCYWAINSKKFPNAKDILAKLSTYYNTQVCYGHSSTAHRISVKSLLGACPNIPTFEDVRANKGRHYNKYIMDPLETSLDALQDEYKAIKWHYCKPNGVPVPDEELEGYKYSDWAEWLIWFELVDYDDEAQKEFAKRLKAKRAGNRENAKAK